MLETPNNIPSLMAAFNVQAAEADRLAEVGAEADWRAAAERVDDLAERIAHEASAETAEGRAALQAVAQRGLRDMGSLEGVADIEHFARATERLVEAA